MTRINVVPVEELTRQHLVAEYRELPRIFGLVKKQIEKNASPRDIKKPSTYVLGKGHVLFFYDKLGWLSQRYTMLCDEMRKRGYNVNYGDISSLTSDIPDEWFGTFKVDDDALKINRTRIQERLK